MGSLPELAPLLGGWLNSLTIRTENWVVNWLTPVWILGLGALVGLLGVLLLWGIGELLSRIPALDQIASTRGTRAVAIAVIAVLVFGASLPVVGRSLHAQWEAKGLQNIAAGEQMSDRFWAYGTAGVIAWFAAASLVMLCRRRTIEELSAAFQEGPLFWISSGTLGLALFGLLGTILIRDPETMLESLTRFNAVGTKQHNYTIESPAVGLFEEAPEQEITLRLRRNELREFRFDSSESLRIAAFPKKPNAADFDISGGETFSWRASDDPAGPLGDLTEIEALYVKNLGNRAAELTITAITGPANPQMLVVPYTAIAVICTFLFYITQRSLTPKLAAVAFATAKSEMATPFFMILTVGGAFLLVLFLWLPYSTFGEDIKMLKFSSLDLIRLFAILQSVWSASQSVADEVEGRTALTVLSKPVSRRDFVVGKFFGIAWTVAAMFVVFSLVFLLCVAYKPIYDSREGGSAPIDITWQLCFSEMIGTVPGLALVFLETLVLAAISVAISTRLSLIPNIMICLSIYILGHLTPLIVQSNVVAEKFEAVVFVGQLIATVIPVLDHFDIQAAIAGNKSVSAVYVAAAALYTAIYCTISMLLGLVFFEDRDLA